MALESATYINTLDAANPTASDPKNQGDDHLRMIKSAVKATFPNVAGAVNPSHTEFNYLVGVTSAIQTQLNARATLTGVETLTNKTLTTPAMTTPVLGNTPITGVKTVNFQAEYDCGNSGTAVTVTLANAQKQKLTLNGNATITISFTGAAVGTYQLRLIQDATGSRTVAWSGLNAARWLSATAAPAVNAAASSETLVNIFYDGTNAVQSMAKVGAV